MTRNKKKDIVVMLGLIMTLSMCVLSFILFEDLQDFHEPKYYNMTFNEVYLSDIILPGSSDIYYDYKYEYESRSDIMTVSFFFSFFFLIFTFVVVKGSSSNASRTRATRPGLTVTAHE